MRAEEPENCRVIRLYEEYQDVLDRINLCEDSLDLDKVKQENKSIIRGEYNRQLSQAIEDKSFEIEYKPRSI